MLEQIEWLTLVTTLPTRNAAARMRLWRAIKALGCATLRDGVYLLPARDETGDALRALADEVRVADGSAEVLHIAADGRQDADFRGMFDRREDYGRLLAAIRTALAAAPDPKAAHALRREFKAMATTDYFPDATQRQVEAALAELSAIASGEPRPAQGAVRRLVSADFAGRTWATRSHLWVDRMASAWLIRRFIDPAARFLWLATPADCPSDALGFDFDGASFSHIAATEATPERVTFEVLAASFGLDADPAIARIGAIVHCIDVGGAPVAEAVGIEAVLAGLRSAAPGDDDLLTEASRIFGSLYLNYLQENDHENNPE